MSNVRPSMTCNPHWTAYLSALLTPIVAVLGSLIAYRQWRLTQNKLKLDLFDRRFSIYQASNTLIASIMTSGRAKDADLFNFLVATKEAKWLLSQEVAEYLDKQLYHKAIDLQTLVAELEGVGTGDIHTTNVRAQADLKKWFLSQYKVLDKHFSQFLTLKH